MTFMNGVRLVLFGAIILYASSCSKEEAVKCEALIDGVVTWVELDKEAEFKDGGKEGFGEWYLGRLKYPAEARENGIEGIVELRYAISDKGKFEDIEIIKDIGGGCGDAVRDVLLDLQYKALFTPAIYQGKPVKIFKIFSVRFILEG